MSWVNIHDMDYHDFADARLQTHYALMWVAYAARWQNWREQAQRSSHPVAASSAKIISLKRFTRKKQQSAKPAPLSPPPTHPQVSPQPPLFWHGVDRAIVSTPLRQASTRPDATSKQELCFGLFIEELTLFTAHNGVVLETMELDGRDQIEVYNWLLNRLHETGAPMEQLEIAISTWLAEANLAPHELQDEGTYDVIAATTALSNLALWLNNAHILLSKLAQQYAYAQNGHSTPANRPPTLPGLEGPSLIPHAFALMVQPGKAAYQHNMQNRPGSGENRFELPSFGFSAGDRFMAEPYFFFRCPDEENSERGRENDAELSPSRAAPHPAPRIARPFPELGYWHDPRGQLALAPISRLLMSDRQAKDLIDFYDHAWRFSAHPQPAIID